MTGRQRTVLAVLGTLLLASVAVGYTLRAGNRDGGSAAGTGEVSVAPGPRLLFRSTADGSTGRLATVDRDHPAGARTVSPLSCNRAYAAGGTALCLRPDGPLTTYRLSVLDGRLRERRGYPIVGIPNRARVSADGALLAWTAFVTGDSYNGGRFSTRVGILDTRTGEAIGTLEEFAIDRDGRPYTAADINFWGVTFAADDRTFYATMATGGHRYLVAGDLGSRTIRTVADNVECPSLSPDGTRLAFKRAVGGDPTRGWRLSVLELDGGTVTPLAETRSVDDQAAWLDDQTVMYALPRGVGHDDVWAVPADGSGTARLLIPDAESPAAL